MTNQTRRELAKRHHDALPDYVRSYLKGRGIPATMIEDKLLGWTGKRITIPIFDAKREVISFRYAKGPQDATDGPKMLSDLGADVELYGWETLAKKPRRVVISEGEFDRLVLEAKGFPAVTSTGGASAFLEEWVPAFKDVESVYICFDRDAAGEAGARKVKSLIPRAHIVTLPEEVGEKGDVTDFFIRLGKEPVDFEVLLAEAAAREPGRDAKEPRLPAVRPVRPLSKKLRTRIERAKKLVPLESVVAKYVNLQARGSLLLGHCPFHDDRVASFYVYLEDQRYHCFGCGYDGDVVGFLREKESMTWREHP